MAEVPPPKLVPPPPELADPMAGDPEDTGQFPVTKADLRRVVRRGLTLQGLATMLGIAGIFWMVWRFGVLALLGEAIAANPVVAQHGEQIRELRGEMKEQRALAIRQLETQLAAAEYVKTGARAPILDAPLPQLEPDGGR